MLISQIEHNPEGGGDNKVPDYAASSAGLEVAQTRNIEAFAEG